MSREQASFSGYGYALLAAALWALLGPVSRLCFSGGMEPLEAAFWRAVIGGTCFAAHGAMRKELVVPFRHGLYFCLFGVVGVGVFFSVYQTAVKESGAALAVILLYTAPVWVALFSRILFKEVLSPPKIFAQGVALAGTALVCVSGGSMHGSPSMLGLVCGLASGFFYAMHYPFNTWWQSRYSTSTMYAYMLWAGALAIFPFIDISLDKSLTTWFGLLVLGIFCTYGAYLAYGQGLRRISPVRAAVVSNLEPVLGTLFSWLWWNESFTLAGWFGCSLVLAAVLLLTLYKGKANAN